MIEIGSFFLDSTTGIILIVGYFASWLLIPWVLLKPRVHESSAIAWLLGIVFIPYLGALLCILVGNSRWKKLSDRKRKIEHEIHQQVVNRYRDEVQLEDSAGRFQALIHLVERVNGFMPTQGNKIRHMADTSQSLAALEEMIRLARQWIHIEFYIWRQDETGQRIHALLMEKARAGIEVRLLYDGIGSQMLGRKYLKSLEEAGVKTAPFTPGWRLNSLGTLHLRNHRKIVVVDGVAGFTGGMNLGDEYVHPTKGFGTWRDTQVIVHGPVVLQLQEVFAQDWCYATEESLTSDRFYPDPRQEGDALCQVVSDGPDNDLDIYYSLLVAALGFSQKRVLLSTPYFVPPEGLVVALKTAAHRGVEVILMIADRGNFLWTKMAGRSYYQDLLSVGVKIREYQAGLYHPKTVVVDGEWCMVGTPNCDYRSLYLNFEIAIASVDRKLCGELEQQFQIDSESALEIHPEQWRQRSKLRRLHEEFWRLFAPVL